MNQIKLSKKKKLQIFPLGDIHIGSPQCNYEFLEKWKEVFKGTKSEKRIYLQGDLLDCAKKSLSNSSYKQTMSVDEQIEYFIKFIKPFKKYINGMVIGNHEARIKKEFDLDIMKIIAESLNIEYANQLYHKYYINEKGLSYSFNDSDMHHLSNNSCCCGDKLVKKTTTFNKPYLYHKYGINYTYSNLMDELGTMYDCNVRSLFASNRVGNLKTISEFYKDRWDSSKSPMSPKSTYKPELIQQNTLRKWINN